MADIDPILSAAGRGLHPAVWRQAGYPAWTADPAVPALFAILRELSALGARLDAIRHDRADLGIEDACGEVGEVASIFERCPDRFFGHGYRTRANGGACAALWEVLGRRRAAWIDARLEAEGFTAHRWSAPRDARQIALEEGAMPVEAAWETFRAPSQVKSSPLPRA